MSTGAVGLIAPAAGLVPAAAASQSVPQEGDRAGPVPDDAQVVFTGIRGEAGIIREPGADVERIPDLPTHASPLRFRPGMSDERVNGFDFLTVEEKAGIFNDNAARFLGLSEKVMAGHREVFPEEAR